MSEPEDDLVVSDEDMQDDSEPSSSRTTPDISMKEESKELD